MSYFGDLLAALKGDAIQLDETEAALIGAPAGETVSMFAAMEAKHGVAFAHLACALLWIVQAHHCADQLLGVPMTWWNYLRAAVLVIGIPVYVITKIWRLVCQFG